LTVRSKSKASRTALVIEFYGNRHLVGNLGDFQGRQTERAPAESLPDLTRADDPAALAPFRPHHRCPLARVERADGAPTAHRNRIRRVEERLQIVRRNRETEIFGDAVAQRDDAEDFALEIDHRTAAVPLLYRHGKLQHGEL